jgi:hypothetical protein
MVFVIRDVAVTRRFIATGFRSNCSACPVALAIKEMLLPNWEVSVYPVARNCEGINFWNPDDFERDWSPAKIVNSSFEMCDWITAFDCGRPVGPAVFPVDFPLAALRPEFAL